MDEVPQQARRSTRQARAGASTLIEFREGSAARERRRRTRTWQMLRERVKMRAKKLPIAGAEPCRDFRELIQHGSSIPAQSPHRKRQPDYADLASAN